MDATRLRIQIELMRRMNGRQEVSKIARDLDGSNDSVFYMLVAKRRTHQSDMVAAACVRRFYDKLKTDQIRKVAEACVYFCPKLETWWIAKVPSGTTRYVFQHLEATTKA